MNKTVMVFIILTFGARAYLQRTSNIRGDTRNLLIGLQRPHNAVTKDTVARWVKTALCRADIDLKLFQVHSVRAAAGSSGFRKQVPLHTLLRTAGWTQESTFRKHYNLPLAMSLEVGYNDEVPDQLDPAKSDILHKILDAKNGEPNKFQSFWEHDEQDVAEFTPEEIENVPEKRILWAAENNKLDILEGLLKSFPHLVNTHDSDGYTPLHRAAYNGHLAVAKCLLSSGANVVAKTDDGWLPIHSACRWNSSSVASLLLDNGSDVNARTNGGLTPLHLAASEQDSRDTLELLLMNPFIDTRIKTNVGETARTICERTSSHHWLFETADECINNL